MSIQVRSVVRAMGPGRLGARDLVAAVAVLVAAASVLAWLGGPSGLLFDNLQELCAAGGGAAALALASRGERGHTRQLLASLAVSLAAAGIGMLAWDLAPDHGSALAHVGDLVFVASVGLGVAAILPAIFAGLNGEVLVGVAIDTLIVFLAGITLLAALWNGSLAATGDHIASLGAVGLVAVTGACVFALMARRIAPAAGGPWALFVGATVLGGSWLMWVGDASASSTVGPSDFLFSIGLLLIARGGVTWDTSPSRSRTFERLARVFAAGLPVAAILGSIAITAATHGSAVLDAVGLSTAAVIATSVARQLMLYTREARATVAERRLAEAIRERAATLISLQRLVPGTTPEETARQVCDEALRLDGIDLAAIRAYSADGQVISLAVEGLGPRASSLAGHPLAPEEAEAIRARAAAGSWLSGPGDTDSSLDLAVFRELGVRATVIAPLRWQDSVIGDIVFGTCSREDEASLGERLSTAEEFGVLVAALLGPAIAERDRVAELQRTIQRIIAGGEFVPVFQPVVELASGTIVGYEALTRFADGTRPDLRFADAERAGIGTALETACLRRSVEEARKLPAGPWLSLNASPQLATDLVDLIEALERLDRDVVIEITEHVPVADYAQLAEAIAALSRGHARFAVDDAGAGYAGLKHILEVRPQFVKLDIALVRGVDLDIARRAMIASMALFARDTACELIAEGIETDGELAALLELGVPYGQGFLLGRPARA